jgi:hypothetical protein
VRHYVAVQDENGRWFYANEGQHRQTGAYGWNPVGACSPWDPCPTCDPWGFRGPAISSEGCATCAGESRVRKAEPCPGHDSQAGAYEHQKQFHLERELKFYPDSKKADTQRRCQVEGCGAFTSGGAHVGPSSRFVLCADHRNRETVERLFCVGESWES